MLNPIEVEIDAAGNVRPVVPLVRLPVGRAVLMVFAPEENEAALLAERALAAEWLSPVEDAAWAHLQPGT